MEGTELHDASLIVMDPIDSATVVTKDASPACDTESQAKGTTTQAQAPAQARTEVDAVLTAPPVPTPKQATGLSSTILSNEVSMAMQQLDTKRAFDMMLVYERFLALESENACLVDQAAFLKERVAQQTRETSEMYHYFHGKLDAHVAEIATLESALALSRTALTQSSTQHAEATEASQLERAQERAQAQAEREALQKELLGLHTFRQQKQCLDDELDAVRAELANCRRQFEEERVDWERQSLVERERVKRDLLERMSETKQELLARTDAQVTTTTKRTMRENELVVEELSYQSREAEKLLTNLKAAEQEVKRLRVQNKLLEENEVLLAKKARYYQKIVGQLKKSSVGAEGMAALIVDEQKVTNEQGPSANRSENEASELLARISVLEESLGKAHELLQVFQAERRFIVAQQDEIIQFLCRTVQDASLELRQKKKVTMCRSYPGAMESHDTTMDRDSSEITVRGALAQMRDTTSMEEVVTGMPALDELDDDDTRAILQFLLDRMKRYQQQLALVYNGRSLASGSAAGATISVGRDALSRQLGVELPPIAPLSPSGTATSPLKIKRRVQAPPHHHYHSAQCPGHPMTGSPCSSSAVNGNSGSGSADGRGSRFVSVPSQGPPPSDMESHLLHVATMPFNFVPSSSVVRQTSGRTSPSKKMAAASVKPPRATASNSLLSKVPNANKDSLLSAWSTDTLPCYEGSDTADT